jgi:hypothetical protein
MKRKILWIIFVILFWLALMGIVRLLGLDMFNEISW